MFIGIAQTFFEVLRFQFWDTAGQHCYRSITAQFYRNTHCCVLVYDISDEKSFKSLDGWLNDFIFKSGYTKAGCDFVKKTMLRIDNVMSFPFVLLGNKLDGAGLRKVKKSDAEEWCQLRSMRFYEVRSVSRFFFIEQVNASDVKVSAFDGTDVDKAFADIATKAVNQMKKAKRMTESIRLHDAQPSRRGCC